MAESDAERGAIASRRVARLERKREPQLAKFVVEPALAKQTKLRMEQHEPGNDARQVRFERILECSRGRGGDTETDGIGRSWFAEAVVAQPGVFADGSAADSAQQVSEQSKCCPTTIVHVFVYAHVAAVVRSRVAVVWSRSGPPPVCLRDRRRVRSAFFPASVAQEQRDAIWWHARFDDVVCVDGPETVLVIERRDGSLLGDVGTFCLRVSWWKHAVIFDVFALRWNRFTAQWDVGGTEPAEQQPSARVVLGIVTDRATIRRARQSDVR